METERAGEEVRAARPAWVGWAWWALILAAPVHRLLSIPPFGHRLQVPELLFLAFAAAVGGWWLRTRPRPRFVPSPVDKGVLLYLLGSTVAGVAHLVRSGVVPSALLELVGTWYLCALYLAVRVSARRELLERAPSVFGVAAAVHGLFGVAGFVLSTAGVSFRWAWPPQTPMPYVHTAARAMGLTQHPLMLASFLTVATLLFLGAKRGSAAFRALVFAAVALGLLVTFSKTVLCLGVGLATWWLLRHREGPRWLRAGVFAAAVGMAAVYVGLSHVLVLPAEVDLRGHLRVGQVAGEPLARGQLAGREVVFLRTQYFYNRVANLRAVARSWPWGLGPGQHNQFVARLREEGLHPKTLPAADPHSTYFGAAAELGVSGLLGLLALVGSVLLGLKRAARAEGSGCGMSAALAAAVTALLLEATCIDVMNFRHAWWLIALVGAYASLAPRPGGPCARGPQGLGIRAMS